MRFRDVLRIALLGGLISLPTIAFGASWSGKSVGHLQASAAEADCFFFTLEGVTEADAVRPGSPWFAVSRSQYGARDAYAMLLVAKLTGQPINISTNGTLSCGFATANAVWAP